MIPLFVKEGSGEMANDRFAQKILCYNQPYSFLRDMGN
jgi:hypothetical protein